jgi:hypothetical protein
LYQVGEVEIPEGTTTAVWHGACVIVGTPHSYIRIDLLSGATSEIVQHSADLEPTRPYLKPLANTQQASVVSVI